MMKASELFPFENRMTKTQTYLGWIYLLLHAAVFPLLFSAYAAFSVSALTEVQANVLYYLIGDVFALTVMFRFLRGSYDVLIDRLRWCILTLLLALLMDYALSYGASLILLLFDSALENPNNAEVMTLAGKEYGMMKAVAVFMAPVVEEVLFRGVVFGSLRTRSRGWAYAVSAVLFSFYHVWQYAVAYADPAMLLYAVQYIPVSIVLAWCYERSGSIWTSAFFHMGFNALSFFVLSML